MRGAQRPLILAGSGVRGGGAPPTPARRRRARCAARSRRRRRRKGVFPESHPLALGVLGLGGHLSARALPRARRPTSSSRSARASATWRPMDSRRSCRRRARSSTSTSTRARSARATRRPTRSSRRRPSFSAGSPIGCATSCRATHAAAPLAGGVERHVAAVVAQRRPDRAAGCARARSRRCCRRDTIFTVDSGEHFLFAAHYLEIDQPDSFIVMTGLGSMGQSIGAAIGAQLAHPDAHGRRDLSAMAASR